MSAAFINNEILKWAITRKGIDAHDVESIHEKYPDWEAGRALPTFQQAKKLAKKLKIPFGYLFLSKPPEEKQPIVDLRTFSDFENTSFSVDLLAAIDDAIRKQNWYQEQLLIEQAESLPFVGKYNIHSDAQSVADDIAKTLRIERQDRDGDLLRLITERAENAGILVLRNGKVGSNTFRKLDVNEFLGFALSNSHAPLVFINSAQYKNTQVFTLVHELAHIWIGQTGVSKNDINETKNHSDEEQFCNEVAAQVLVPSDSFRREWKQINGKLQSRCDALKKIFNVSTIVLARRALDLNCTTRQEFFDYYEYLVGVWEKKKKEQSSRGDFQKTFPITNSTILTNAVCHAVYSGNMLLRNGARLLNVKPSTLDEYARQRRLS